MMYLLLQMVVKKIFRCKFYRKEKQGNFRNYNLMNKGILKEKEVNLVI